MYQIELIEFFKPIEDSKNVYVSNIIMNSDSMDSEQIIKFELYKSFSRFGLLHEVQVFPSTSLTNSKATYSNTNGDTKKQTAYYAFVKFYSKMSAQQAKSSLHLTSIVGTDVCKNSKMLLNQELLTFH